VNNNLTPTLSKGEGGIVGVLNKLTNNYNSSPFGEVRRGL